MYIPILSSFVLVEYDLRALVVWSAAMLLLLTLYSKTRPRKVYLLDFACHKPEPARKTTTDVILDRSIFSGAFTEENIEFQRKILEKSGIGQESYFPEALWRKPSKACLQEALKETKMVIVGAVDELLQKTGLDPADIGILIVNCSLFSPSPSLTAMVVNHYELRPNIRTFNLGGMGCSASPISIHLATHLLQVHVDNYALIVSTENITQNWYHGNTRSMLVTNCLFRMGTAAILLSNCPTDRGRSKYLFLHAVRTHMAADDTSYSCITQKEDPAGIRGVSLSRHLTTTAGAALHSNLRSLAPLVLPLSEQLTFLATRALHLIAIVKPYIPDFTRSFEHFCIHSGGCGVLDEVERSLKLSSWHLEPSRMTLYRFGNLSSSSLWYELAYVEAKGRVKKGDRVWQVGFGSGFKCNSLVWCALSTVDPCTERNPWMDEIDNFPVRMI